MDNSINAISKVLDLERHPLYLKSREFKTSYIISLKYFCDIFSPRDPLARQALAQFAKTFLGSATAVDLSVGNDLRTLPRLLRNTSGKKARSFCPPIVRYNFLTDCFYLFAPDDEKKGQSILLHIKGIPALLSNKKFDAIFEAFYHGGRVDMESQALNHYVDALRENVRFISLSAQRILVAATMSAGKSTLINSVIGKPLARTSQEACTGYLHTYYNKPVEDNIIGLCVDGDVVVGAEIREVKERQRSSPCDVATYFRTMRPLKSRVCIIDTPGANFAINAQHGQIARGAIRDGDFHRMVYVFNASGGLGSDEETKYLRFIADTVPKDKLIFVLNQLDNFRGGEDSVRESFEGVRGSLVELGFTEPVILPFSAYFAYLIKLKLQNMEMDEDQRDDFERLSRKFSRPQYDLSGYYDKPEETSDDPLFRLSVRCGLYGLEKNILRG